jgi:hypothetical protein
MKGMAETILSLQQTFMKDIEGQDEGQNEGEINKE